MEEKEELQFFPTDDEEQLEDLDALKADLEKELAGSQDEEEEVDNEQDNKEEESEDDSQEPNEDNENKDKEEESQDNADDKEQSDDNNNQEEDKEQEVDFKPITVNVNGHDISIDSQEELQKMIATAGTLLNQPEDKLKDEKLILEQGKLSAEDLKLLVDAKNGNADAVAKLAKIGGVDYMDITEESGSDYKPQFDVTKPTEVEIVAKNILKNESLASKFQSISSTLPDSFIHAVTSNAKDLQGFANHIETGLAEEIIPQAMKLMYQGMDFSQAYVQVGTKLVAKKGNNNSGGQEQEQRREVSDREADLRNKAKENGGNGQSNKTKELTEDDIWNMTDDEFKEYVSKGGD